MQRAKSLPPYLLERYHKWRSTTYPDIRDELRRLMSEGQSPRAMVVACCDSRVAINEVFGQKAGELFVHRNIANLVPPYTPDGEHHGTAAAVEFAVTALKVSHIVVMGHSSCGGVRGCIDMCSGNAPELELKTSFIGRWLDVLKVGFDRVADIADADRQQTALEKEGVLVSLENLMSYPFVARAVDEGRLSLHGLWTELAEGELETFDGEMWRFVAA